MPSTRLTLISNASQKIRCPLLLPSDAPDPKALLFATAKTKLRIKKPTRVFLHGGHELHTPADILTFLHNDLTLIISSGEEYIGAPAPAPTIAAPVRTITSELVLDPLSLTQLESCARLPGIIAAVGLPDLHPGTKFPIGCAFISETHIHPPLIGGDIGCGMSYYRTTLKPTVLADASSCKRVAGTLTGLEGQWLTTRERNLWLSLPSSPDTPAAPCGVGEPWDSHLGTIGAGNHFAELQIVSEILPYTPESRDIYTPPFTPGEVILLVHSGSRGYGQNVLSQYHTTTTSLLATSAPAESYLEAHDKACAWARRNRDLIALRFLNCLEPSLFPLPDTLAVDQITALNTTLLSRKVLDIHHNNITRASWPPSAPPEEQKEVYIHRKGAAPATPETPFLPLPGSRGTPTLLLRPLFPDGGEKNVLSLAHGAGRSMARKKAREGLERKYGGDVEVMTEMKAFSRGGGQGKGMVQEGAGWVICDDKELVWEEAPEAYKDVEVVGREMELCGVAVVVGRCVPRVTYKVRKHGE